jgi:hypothetical protein
MTMSTVEEMARQLVHLRGQLGETREAADNLAAALGRLLGVDLGERSADNDPWRNALVAAANTYPDPWRSALVAVANATNPGVDAADPPSDTAAAPPRIVVLCGSTRFYDAFQQANYDLTMGGQIVLSVGFYPHAAEHGHGEGVGHDSADKVRLDELHKRKIDLADYVHVLNVGGYVGSSTRSEIGYAQAAGKPVTYLEMCRRCATRPSVGQCCTSHRDALCHGCYRTTHFVEVCVDGCAACAQEGLTATGESEAAP